MVVSQPPNSTKHRHRYLARLGVPPALISAAMEDQIRSSFGWNCATLADNMADLKAAFQDSYRRGAERSRLRRPW